MNRMRAKEISESPDTIKVTYQGTPVYIQHVNDDSETARVFPLDEPEKEQEVQLAHLIED
ncbi:H-type small acid-soluble spore protein [Evansella clarkii]|jgi:small acid-soluble spore protein H (minor)|uniref:H-type small acid-soluble spore protein n=1 Tax=Evansella clarkii TaxID=79879 RepID=UPI0009976E7B|nr:H-type small acid-soluble spore protein [Evansella clarkii]